MPRQQVFVERVHDHQAPGVAARSATAARRRWRAGSLPARRWDWRDTPSRPTVRQARLQDPAQHGLAAADLAGDLDDALALTDGVDQRLQHRAAIAAFEEEIGVGSDLEGRLRQPEECVVHQCCLSDRPGCGRHGGAAVVLHAAVERRAMHAEQLGGLAQVAVGQCQRGLDVAALDLLQSLVEAEALLRLQLALGGLHRAALIDTRQRVGSAQLAPARDRARPAAARC